MAKDSSFQNWWNEKYFDTTTPLYKTYEKFHNAGADLEYIDFLSKILEFGDVLPSLDQQRRQRKRRGRDRHSNPRPPLSELRLSEALAIDEDYKKSIAIVKQATRVLDELKRPWLKHPLFIVLEEYNHSQIVQFGKGRKADTWGSLFLLAVTEYMKTKTKKHKPNLSLAYRLLQALRHKSIPLNHEGRSTAKRLIDKLKSSHPTWPTALTLIRLQFNKRKQILQLNAYSEPNRPPIPIETGHGYEANRPPCLG